MNARCLDILLLFARSGTSVYIARILAILYHRMQKQIELTIHNREQDYGFASSCRWSKGGSNLQKCFICEWNLKWNAAACSKFCIYSFIFNVISNCLCEKPNNYSSSFNPMWFIDLRASNHRLEPICVWLLKKTNLEKLLLPRVRNLSIDVIGKKWSAVISSWFLLSYWCFSCSQVTTNLVSVGQLVDDGHNVIFSNEGCIIQDHCTGYIKGRGHRFGVYLHWTLEVLNLNVF